jgi:hypothetical protein
LLQTEESLAGGFDVNAEPRCGRGSIEQKSGHKRSFFPSPSTAGDSVCGLRTPLTASAEAGAFPKTLQERPEYTWLLQMTSEKRPIADIFGSIDSDLSLPAM